MCSLDKRGSVYILTLTGNDEHRLSPILMESISAALRSVRSDTSVAALITTAEGKFFCNGGDIVWAQSDKDRLVLLLSKIRSLFTELMCLPMPTIAAVSGHAVGAGFHLALCHDYILMRKDRGFLYMSELDNGRILSTSWSTGIIKTKIRDPAVWRDVVLGAEKVRAEAAVEKGIIKAAYDSAEETMSAAVKLGEELVGRKWKGEVYAQNRRFLFGDVLRALAIDENLEDLNNKGFLIKESNSNASRL